VFVGGFDFDTHAVHLVLVDLDGLRTPWYHAFPLTGDDAFDRLRDVARVMPYRSSILYDECVAFGIEEPQGRHKATVAKLKAVQGAIVASLPAHALVHPLEPARWRSLCGLKGNAPKDTVKFHSIWSWLPPEGAIEPEVDRWPQDAHDAHLIALATRRLLDQQEKAA
jgi:hypothetical protein